MKVVCIIQARVGSTRLPNKVLRRICGKTILEYDIDRVKKVKSIDEIVIATTTKEQDDSIEHEARRLQTKCFRGSEEDVLERYYFAAKNSKADVVVRITSDCPLIDIETTNNIVDFFIKNSDKFDYVSNTLDRTYPRGLDTEVFKFSSLEMAYLEADSIRDREHVTPYIWSNETKFKIFQYKNHIDYSHHRWTVDTNEDLELITNIYEYFSPKTDFCMTDIISYLNKNPELVKINSHIEQKKIDESLFLIDVNEAHCKIIFDWANDEAVRANSFNSSKIAYNDHIQWFNNKLHDKNSRMYILSDSNNLLGLVRVDRKEDEFIISYSIDKNQRGKGLAYKMLSLLEKKILGLYGISKFVGLVKPENKSSIKVFQKLEYIVEENKEGYLKFSKIIK